MFKRQNMNYLVKPRTVKMNASADSLLIICSKFISRNLLLYKDSGYLEVLPVYIKDRIVTYVTRVFRGFHDDQILNALLHENLIKINLSTSKITDDTLRLLAKHCPKIKSLTMNYAEYSFTREVLLQTIPKLTRLEALHVCNCKVLDDEFLQEISKNCPLIELLDIGGCKNITDNCVDHLKHLKLNKLNVANTFLTDLFLVKLGSSSLNDTIEEINVSHCNITNDGLINLRWDKLKYIGFQGCDVNDLAFIAGNKNIRSIEWTIAK